MATTPTPQKFTKFGWFVLAWILLSSFQYGFHISVLNQIKAVVTCKADINSPRDSSPILPPCIPMSDESFSAVTASFTIGGLLGSLFSDHITNRNKSGRKGAISTSAVLVGLGSALMSVSASIPPFFIGRTIVGVGAGIGISVGPVYISEIAPSAIKGSVGVLTQVSVVFGILFTQAIGMHFARPSHWRYVTAISAALSIFQLLVSPFSINSPSWLDGNGYSADSQKASTRLWGSSATATDHTDNDLHRDGLEDPLLSEEGGIDHSPPPYSTKSKSVLQLLKMPDMRRAVYIMAFAMLAQQFSGINAVLYYSNDILSKTLPSLAAYVSLGITVVNALMTFPAIFLIESMGRRSLLAASILGALISLVLVGYGIDTSNKGLSSVAIVAFVAAFACGLGPVPFVMIGDLVPFHTVAALSSFALSVNWIANFIVGLVFLPLRNFLAWGDPLREGRVFYVFAAALAFFTVLLALVYKRG